MPVALAAFMGAIIGSFLNVVAYRLPRGESLATPGSHCPLCDTPIKAYDNVPVLAWLWLRGRCRNCGGVDLGSLSAGRGADGPSMRGRGPSRRRDAGGRTRPGARPDPHADRPDRPRPPADPERDHRAGGDRRGGDRPRARPGRRAGAPDRRARPPAASCCSRYSRTHAGWEWATSSWPRSSACSLAAPSGPGLLIALVSGVVAGAVVMARVGVAAGRRTKVPFGPVPRSRRRRRHLRRRRARLRLSAQLRPPVADVRAVRPPLSTARNRGCSGHGARAVPAPEAGSDMHATGDSEGAPGRIFERRLMVPGEAADEGPEGAGQQAPVPQKEIELMPNRLNQPIKLKRPSMPVRKRSGGAVRNPTVGREPGEGASSESADQAPPPEPVCRRLAALDDGPAPR